MPIVPWGNRIRSALVLRVAIVPRAAIDRDRLPYRACVGAAVFSPAGLVWIGQRVGVADAEEGLGSWWQMPQGGLDDGEDPEPAARRELWEETSMRTVSLLGAVPGWFTYELPDELLGIAWGGRYLGQKQKWFAYRFEGHESEIDIAHPGGGAHKPEFAAWRWERVERLPELVVEFKRDVYRQLLPYLEQFAAQARAGRR